ncbi:hypothetical protein ACFW2Y_17500 [Streptomyces sp. NPDC058877]
MAKRHGSQGFEWKLSPGTGRLVPAGEPWVIFEGAEERAAA